MSKFHSKTPEEVKVVTFDFEPEAAEGAVLSAPDLTIEVVKQNADGTATPGDITQSGLNVPVGTQTVQVLIGGGLDGATYRLSCLVDADNGEVHQIDKDLPISVTGALV